jgi:hypothetical protein
MTKLYVDDGRVPCPRRGDLDVDHCVGCADLRDIKTEKDEQLILCAARNRICPDWWMSVGF